MKYMNKNIPLALLALQLIPGINYAVDNQNTKDALTDNKRVRHVEDIIKNPVDNLSEEKIQETLDSIFYLVSKDNPIVGINCTNAIQFLEDTLQYRKDLSGPFQGPKPHYNAYSYTPYNEYLPKAEEQYNKKLERDVVNNIEKTDGLSDKRIKEISNNILYLLGKNRRPIFGINYAIAIQFLEDTLQYRKDLSGPFQGPKPLYDACYYTPYNEYRAKAEEQYNKKVEQKNLNLENEKK